MHTDYSPLRRFSQWLSRWRHRRGYGVHSPWAFSWITQVIYNDMAYYAYADLQRRRRLPATDPEALAGALNEKDDRLLFRVANAAEANDIAVVGKVGARERAYLSAARTQARLTTYETLPPESEKRFSEHDFFYFASTECLPSGSLSSLMLDSADEKKCRPALVCGISRDAPARAAWQRFIDSPEVCVSFDLGRFGLAFFCPKLHKQHYVVAYF